MEETPSKVVYLRRLPITTIEKQAKPADLHYFNQGFRDISSYFVKDSMRPGTGIPIKHEDILLPYILNMSKDDRGFRKAVTDFYFDITTRVDPHDPVRNIGGTPLEISLEDPTKPLSADNLPVNIIDYLRYKHALSHPEVAPDQKSGAGDMLKAFYIYDPEREAENQERIEDLKDEALEAYGQIKGKASTIMRYLSVLEADRSRYEGNERAYLRSIADSNPVRFLEVHKDPDLKLKHFVNVTVELRILERVGDRLVWAETKEFFASDAQEAVAYLKDPKNNETYMSLRANVEERLKSRKKNKE